MSAQINQLVTLAKSGDADAFGELYELYYKEMFYYARCVTGDDELAKDAVSDAVLSAFRQISSLKKPEAFKGWLFKILCASCKRQYTENQHKNTLVWLDGDEGVEKYPLPPDGTEELIALKEALAILTHEEREIVILSTVENYKSHEIAQMLGIKAVTVRSKLKRALKKMRDFLEDNGKGG